MPLKIRRRPQAKVDAVDIWFYVANDSVTAADALLNRIDEALVRLSDYPLSGAERNELIAGLRICPVDNYVIYYRVEPDHLDVLRVLHAARNISVELFSD